MKTRTSREACECEGTGYVAVADGGGDGTDYIECAVHHPSYAEVLSVDDLITHLASVTGVKF